MNRRLPNVCWLLGTAISVAQGANTWTVTATGSGGACTANSTTDVNCTFDAAINGANSGPPGDTVLFSAGVQGHVITYAGASVFGITIDGSPNGVTLDGGGTNGPLFYFVSGTSLISHITLQNASSSTCGGAILMTDPAILTIDSSAIVNNHTTNAGGGVCNQSSYSVTIINSTIANNSVGSSYVGGGVASDPGQAVISNTTITGNTGAGGGIEATHLVISSSIVAGNSYPTDPTAADILAYGTPTTLGHNLIGIADGFSGTPDASDQFGSAASPIDALFATAGLANNGGATPTFALQSASPARRAGNCAGNASNPVIPAVTVDQRGVARSTPCTTGAFDMTSIFFDGFE